MRRKSRLRKKYHPVTTDFAFDETRRTVRNHSFFSSSAIQTKRKINGMSASLKTTMPRQVAVSVNELLDRCAGIKAGQEVLIVAAPDGLTGGYNVVDEACVAWIQAAVQQRGAHPAVLWVDILSKVHAWRVPPVVKAAVAGANVVISHAFDLPFEELYELRDLMAKHRAIFVRNMATTAKLLASDWAQTPYELVSEIRIRAAQMFKEGLAWTLTHDNGTRLSGKIRSPLPASRKYADRRTEGFYRPFPEGCLARSTCSIRRGH